MFDKTMDQSEFNKLVVYTLRVELLNGKVLLYRIDADSKNYLIARLRANSDGDEQKPKVQILWFETSHNRQVIINCDSIARVTFCYDYSVLLKNPESYFDNFDVVHTEDSLEEMPTQDGESRLHVVHEEFIPSGIIYHKGMPTNDDYYTNPLVYHELDEGELGGINFELAGDFPLRQFINLTDDEGEEGFIPFDQIIAIEVMKGAIFPDLMQDPD
jgi:hypothetical protein